MKNLHIIALLSLLLAACTTPPTPFLDVTATAPPAVTQTFTARVTVGALDIIQESTIYLNRITLRYVTNAEGKVEIPTDYASPICYITPDNLCKTQGADELLIGSLTLSIESGCWRSTKQGQDYSVPEPC